jgi:glucosylceramidase
MPTFRRRLLALATCFVLTAAGLFAAQPAVAAGTYGPYYIRTNNQRTYLCMDAADGNTANGARIQQWGCWEGPMQRWTMHYKATYGGIAYYELINGNSPPGSPKCLAVPWGSPPAGTALELWDCIGAARQMWVFEPLPGTGMDQIRNLQSNQCVDVRDGNSAQGATLQQWPCWGGMPQQWYATA